MNHMDVAEECLRDKPFYDESDGGITLSGGEPSFQAEFAVAVLKVAKSHGVHTVVETNGYCAWDRLEMIARHTDMFLFDLKIMDKQRSQATIGADSDVILENLKRLDGLGKIIVVRFPLIPGYTSAPNNIDQVFAVTAGLRNAVQVDVLPFHQFGKHKFRALGYSYDLKDYNPLSREQARELVSPYSNRIHTKIFG